jgi:acetate kinase
VAGPRGFELGADRLADAVLVLNSGSSSIKFAVFDLSANEPALICEGLLDEHEAAPRLIVNDPSGKKLHETHRSATDKDGDGLFVDILTWLDHFLARGALAAVGHRVVHGGRDFVDPVEITEARIEALDALTPLAPLHQPRCLSPMRAIRTLRPELCQIACFDTAFHHGLAPTVRRFAIPRRFEDAGIRRYGFHGLSYEYIAGRLAAMSPEMAAKRTVVAHLGNGASLCAMREGRSVDTTMGLTPLDGLVMGTRCGQIDPGVLLYLLQETRMPVADLEHLLYQESGLLGVSGLSADMRTLEASKDAAAAEAIDLFSFRVAQQVAAMTATLSGLDCLVFTGGIGEHSGPVREQICERLHWLGVRLDAPANDQASARINSEGSAVDVLVIPTSEETVIARYCAAMLTRRRNAGDDAQTKS